MENKKRIKILPKQQKRLFEKNANACCVCKKRGIGLNLHHIDENPANNIDDNIAVLCVNEHDAHHRPTKYPSLNHLDLSSEEIKNKKLSWEKFVEECKKENPNVLATISAYGSDGIIYGMKIVFQWKNGKIEFERVYQVMDSHYEVWGESAIQEVLWLGKNIKVVMIKDIIPIEYCENGNGIFSRILDENMAIKVIEPDWDKQSICTIYINPNQPSLALCIFYKEELIYSLYVEKRYGTITLNDEKRKEEYIILSNPSIRTQVVKIVNKKLKDWGIKRILIGTGKQEDPDIIEEFNLPYFWEKRNSFAETNYIEFKE